MPDIIMEIRDCCTIQLTVKYIPRSKRVLFDLVWVMSGVNLSKYSIHTNSDNVTNRKLQSYDDNTKDLCLFLVDMHEIIPEHKMSTKRLINIHINRVEEVSFPVTNMPKSKDSFFNTLMLMKGMYLLDCVITDGKGLYDISTILQGYSDTSKELNLYVI